jgi:FtsP/CotA-like multicopper oxidase with cupredoxin domain
MDCTAPAVYHGPAGFHLVRDDEEDALPLPRGPRELPPMICDRAVAADGSFAYPAPDPRIRELAGVDGPWMAGVEVAARFTEHAGRYVLHCHNLEHEDMAMMATIRTI